MPRRSADPASLLQLAIGAAREAGVLLLERFGGPAQGVSTKSTRTDLVSDADRDAEAVIVGRVRAARPQDAIIAEEGGSTEGDAAEVTWHIDPLDGTVNYLWGLPHWCVSIHAGDRHGDLAAVIWDPCREELFTAVPGDARLNGHGLRLTAAYDLSDALVATGFAYAAPVRRMQGAVVARLLPDVRDIRRAGSAALDLAWLAAGRVDAYFERGLSPWDWAAGAMLVTAAGGTVTQLDDAGAPPGIVAGRAGLVEPLLTHIAQR